VRRPKSPNQKITRNPFSRMFSPTREPFMTFASLLRIKTYREREIISAISVTMPSLCDEDRFLESSASVVPGCR
jgi:hypothetical protein